MTGWLFSWPGVTAPATPPTLPGQAPSLPWPLDEVAKWLDGIVDGVISGLSSIWNGFVSVLNGVWTWIQQNVLNPIIAFFTQFFNGVTSMITSGMGTIFNAFVSMVHPGSPLTPESAMAVFGVVSAITVAASIGVTMVNIAHPFKTIIQEQTIAFIYKFLGFNELAGAFWGAIGGEVLDEPLRMWARMTFRARYPGHDLLDRLYFHGLLSETDWFTFHTYLGWKDEQISAHFEEMHREPSIREILLATDAIGVDRAWVSESLKHSGYAQDSIDRLLPTIMARPLVDELKAFRSQAITAYVNGEETIEQLLQDLKDTHLSNDEIAFVLRAAGIRRSRREASDQRAADKATAAAAAKAAAEQAAIEKAAAKQTAADLAAATKAAEASRKAEEKAAAAARAAATAQVLRDQEAARKALQDAAKQAFVESYGKDLITDSELLQGLLGLGIPADRAGEIVAVERIRKLPTPQRLRPGELTATQKQLQAARKEAAIMGYQRDLMAEGDLLEELIADGIDQDVATQLVYIEILRKIPKPKVSSTPLSV